MTAVYKLKTQGTSPLTLDTAKAWLKIPLSNGDEDDLLNALITAVTLWGEKYTGRDFRANTWTLLLDTFEARICLRRGPVASITFVRHLVSSSQATVDASVYYLKKDVQFSEILLSEGEDWPTDTDDREQAIEIEFVTEAAQCIEIAIDAMKRQLAWLYANRGDCTADQAAKESGATAMYDLVSIPRL